MSKTFQTIPFYRRITSNALYLLAGIGLANVARFSANVVLARQFRVEVYGAISFLIGVVNMIVFIADLGLFTAMTKQVAEKRGSDLIGVTTRSFLQAIWLSGLVGTLVCGGIIATLSPSLLGGMNVPGVWLMGGWVLTPLVVRSFIALYTGFENMRFALFNYFLEEPLKLMTLFLLLFMNKLTPQHLVWVWTLTSFLTIIAVVAVGQHFLAIRVEGIAYRLFQWSEIMKRLQEGMLYFLPFIGRTMMPPIVTVILGMFASHTETAWFAAAVSLSSAVSLILGPISNALLPAFTTRYAQTGQAITPSEGGQLLRMLAIFNVFVLLGFVIAGTYIIQLAYGEEYKLAIGILLLLAAANFFESFRLGIDPLLNSINAALTVSLIEVVRFMIMLPSVIGLGWRFGAIGAASGVLIASLICNIIRLLTIRKLLNIPKTGILSLRYIIWVGSALFGWHLQISSLLLLPLMVSLGWLLKMYQPNDVLIMLRLLRGTIKAS